MEEMQAELDGLKSELDLKNQDMEWLETEHVLADTFIVIEFEAADGTGDGTIVHHDLFGSHEGLLEIDGVALPVDMALAIEGPVLWADEERTFVIVQFEPGPEVPEEYYLSLTGEIDVETGFMDGTLLDVQKEFGCGSIEITEG